MRERGRDQRGRDQRERDQRERDQRGRGRPGTRGTAGQNQGDIEEVLGDGMLNNSMIQWTQHSGQCCCQAENSDKT